MNAKHKRRTVWIGVVFCSLIAAYFLTTPFILPRVIDRPAARIFYSPMIHGIEDYWFGCGFFRWYCFDVCHMRLLMKLEFGKDDL